MADTDAILKKARELGEMISGHEAAKKLEAVLKRLEQDDEAQRVLTDYNRHLQTLAEKQQQGQPIEVEDKQKLEKLQKQVVTSPVLGDFQAAQMDYVDLMRRVDQALTGETPASAGGAAAAGGAASPLGSPGMSGMGGQ